MTILFLNHKIKECGVYQYGYRLYDILYRSSKHTYVYEEIDCIDEYNNMICKWTPSIIIYNYHASTMPWLSRDIIGFQKHIHKHIGISHESDDTMFDIVLCIDPEQKEMAGKYNIPRPIYENIEDIVYNTMVSTANTEFIYYNEGLDIPIFGSFGFGFLNKGFDKIIKLVNDQYERAIIKLVMPRAHFDPHSDYNTQMVNSACTSIGVHSGIKVMISNEFFTNEELLVFLSKNTANIFLYDTMFGRGISSTIDYALSVKKPIIISDSYMFRHIYNDDICAYKLGLRDCIEHSRKRIPEWLDKYSNKNLINKIDTICSNVLNNVLNSRLNKYIFENLVVHKAVYFPMNTDIYGIVVDIMNKVIADYYISENEVMSKCNCLFPDTYKGIYKTLYLTVGHKDSNELFYFEFGEDRVLDFHEIANKIHNKIKKVDIKIRVSFGEIVDKYSILELKRKYITNPDKLVDINAEFIELENIVGDHKTSIFYKMLLAVNDRIWRDTDAVKMMSIDNADYENIWKFASLTASIFDDNQRRFRLKHYFNNVSGSAIREHKSYSANSCFIWVDDVEEIYDKLADINWLCVSYDSIVFDEKYRSVISAIFCDMNILYSGYKNEAGMQKIVLSNYNMPVELKGSFEFEPIVYKGFGRLGDFLNQLSVVCEEFYKTGRKGMLYIDDNPGYTGGFVYGIERAYNDTYGIISKQKYIKDYCIYSGQKIDIELSRWRDNINSFSGMNWHQIYGEVYNIPWALHKWINIGIVDDDITRIWRDKILINITPYRFINDSGIATLLDKIRGVISDCVFITNDKEHYDVFCEKIGLEIAVYYPTGFSDMVAVINSCKICYFGFSAPAVIANALHKDHYLLGTSGLDVSYNNFVSEVPHLLGIIM